MTPLDEQIMNEVYASLDKHHSEIQESIKAILAQLPKRAGDDFEELLDGSDVTGKVEIVDAPKGTNQKEKYGVFKEVHVDQWCNGGYTGDNFEGDIYAKCKLGWLKIPYSC